MLIKEIKDEQMFEEKTEEATLTITQTRKNIVAGLAEAIEDNTIDRPQANDVLDKVFNQFGWTSTEEEQFHTYTVTVSLFDEEIMTVTGVEANNAYEAESTVSDNISIDRIRVSVDVSYEGEYGSYNGDGWLDDHITDNLSYDSTVED